ncbi:hypothetical protein EV363DRAFT_1270918 [Boletus edulis]|uniref:F-box domain-containing protein n=1 Tax=Boletus edulis BED1 TaxID=1328754 RepID=A0AAD4BCS4_BOLED|nr:hypothetical protein EV363DRAFT_1270918 [Boletus edulis]KAF8420955.1 hypothetical protein L210DRAFT_3654652 [Boletus edulis BED1]KAF8441636.1 hypothetical protein L210DRAFT_3537754 [Boletus edulis BED1]
MHRALEIQEILLNIFGHCHYPTTDLAALARTCRAFKDPALDVLWETLPDLSPLAQCVPEASQLLWAARGDPESYCGPSKCYSLHRSLTQNEWDILRSYTRRIRSINTLYGLNRKSLKRLWRPPIPEPLFPNIRHLYFEYTHRAVHFLLMPFPSLISLDVEVHNLRLFEDSIKSLAKTSSCLRQLLIYADLPTGVNTDFFDPIFIRQWRNLQTLVCPEISMDVITLVHLSRMPALSQLNFKLGSTFPYQIPPSDSPLVFSNLNRWVLRSQSLYSISCLLSQTRLPAVTIFVAYIECCPSRVDLSAWFAGVQTSGFGHCVQELHLGQSISGRVDLLGNTRVLGFEDLRPCMAFSHLRCIDLRMDWQVDLTDNELLSLTSTWPHLETFNINRQWGWNTLGGITPNGLIQLLQICPLLTDICIAIDTRGYTEIPPLLQSVERSTSIASYSIFSIDVLDSFIEAESVPAITAFFADIMPRSNLLLYAWNISLRGTESVRLPNRDVCENLWEDVRQRVKDAVRQSR